MALNKVRALLKLNPAKESAEGQELEMLITLIEAYEDVHVPMQASDPIAYLVYRMEQDNLKQVDLIPFIGDKTKVLNPPVSSCLVPFCKPSTLWGRWLASARVRPRMLLSK